MIHTLAAPETLEALFWTITAAVLWAALIAWPFLRFFRRTEDGEG